MVRETPPGFAAGGEGDRSNRPPHASLNLEAFAL